MLRLKRVIFISLVCTLVLFMNAHCAYSASEDTGLSSGNFETLSSSGFNRAFLALNPLEEVVFNSQWIKTYLESQSQFDNSFIWFLKQIFNQAEFSELIFSRKDYSELFQSLLLQIDGLFDSIEELYHEDFDEVSLSRFHDAKLMIGGLALRLYDLSNNSNQDSEEQQITTGAGTVYVIEKTIRRTTARVKNVLKYHHKKAQALGRGVSCWKKSNDAINSFLDQEGSNLRIVLPVLLSLLTVIGVNKIFEIPMRESAMYAVTILALIYVMVYLIEHTCFEDFAQIQPSEKSQNELRKMLQSRIKFLNESLKFYHESTSKDSGEGVFAE